MKLWSQVALKAQLVLYGAEIEVSGMYDQNIHKYARVLPKAQIQGLSTSSDEKGPCSSREVGVISFFRSPRRVH